MRPAASSLLARSFTVASSESGIIPETLSSHRPSALAILPPTRAYRREPELILSEMEEETTKNDRFLQKGVVGAIITNVFPSASISAKRNPSSITSQCFGFTAMIESVFKVGQEIVAAVACIKKIVAIDQVEFPLLDRFLLSMGIPPLALNYAGICHMQQQTTPLMQDFNTMNCVAPRRSRSRINNSGSSGNIGVMTKLREEGWFDEAIGIVNDMDKQGMEITNNVLLCLLSEAIKRKDLKQGKEIHRLTKKHNMESDTFLGTFLVRFYSTCGLLREAIEAFAKVTDMSVYTWSAMISAHAKLGKPEDGLKVYRQMLQESSLVPEENVFVATLEACAAIPSLENGKEVHKYILEHKCEHKCTTNINIGCALIDMYTKCGDFDEARKVFERLPKRELAIWNAMIGCYARFQRIPEALRLIEVLQQERLKPNDVTFGTILKACAHAQNLEQGKLVHARISDCQFDTNLSVANALMEMYAKCGNLDGFHSVLYKLRQRDAGTWNTVVDGYMQLGDNSTASQLRVQIQREATMVNEVFVSLLKACASSESFDEIKRTHSAAMGGMKLDPLVGTTLIDVYLKSNKLLEARRVFDIWTVKPLTMWNSIIGGHVRQRLCSDASTLLKKMLQEDGVKPSEQTFLCILEGCLEHTDLEVGKEIHRCITDCGLQENPVIRKAVDDMYGRCANIMVKAQEMTVGA